MIATKMKLRKISSKKFRKYLATNFPATDKCRLNFG